jgi:hypothetical protein
VVVMSFVANEGLMSKAEWPVSATAVEMTVNGYDMVGMDEVEGLVKSAEVPVVAMEVALKPAEADGRLILEVIAGAGEEVVLETTTDLNAWSEVQRVVGRGAGLPVSVLLTPQDAVEARFWRIRMPPILMKEPSIRVH